MAPKKEFNPKFGQLVKYAFSKANLDTGQTNVDLTVVGALSGNTLDVMPAAGSVVGIGVKGNADCTAGTITFRAHKSSTEFAQDGYPAPVINATTGTSNVSYATCRPGICTFSAGDQLGISYTSTAAFTPGTIDYDADLYVMFDA